MTTTTTKMTTQIHQTAKLKGFTIEIFEKDEIFYVALKGPNGFSNTINQFNYLIDATRFLRLVLSF